MDASQPGARSAAVNLCMYRCEGMARIASKERAGVYIPIGERWWWRGRTQMKAETAEAEPTSKTIRRPGQGRARQQPPGERRGRAAREASVSCPFLLLSSLSDSPSIYSPRAVALFLIRSGSGLAEEQGWKEEKNKGE